MRADPSVTGTTQKPTLIFCGRTCFPPRCSWKLAGWMDDERDSNRGIVL